MRLEVHLIEDRLDRPIADGRDDPIFDRLAGQIWPVQWVMCKPLATGSRQAN